MKIRQLWNSTWIPTGEYTYDICCGCGLSHKVTYRWNQQKHRLEERWQVVKPIKPRKPRAAKDKR